MELERLLQRQGFGSRAQCRALVLDGRVATDGACCTDPHADVPAREGWSFSVDGEAWVFREHVYLAMNKPGGVECSHRPHHYPSVYRLLPLPLVARGVQAVGRLDQDTTGLLLFSDDGQFIHRFTSPRKNIAKIYEAQTAQTVDDALLCRLRDGVQLHDEPAPVAARSAERIGECALRLSVTEGKYHLVKRMIAAAGNHVEALHRKAVGGFELPGDLPPGGWAYLDEDALTRLGAA